MRPSLQGQFNQPPPIFEHYGMPFWCAGEDLGFVTLGLGFYQYERDVCQRGRICATEPGGASSQAVL